MKVGTFVVYGLYIGASI